MKGFVIVFSQTGLQISESLLQLVEDRTAEILELTMLLTQLHLVSNAAAGVPMSERVHVQPPSG